jgi:hypothetical protein
VRGPAWLDSTVLMVGVRRFGGHDTDALLDDIALLPWIAEMKILD